MAVVATLAVLLVALALGGLYLLSGARVFITGASQWAQAQKEVAITLDRYVLTGDAAHLARFEATEQHLRHIGDAYEALATGDDEAALGALAAGGIDPADARTVVRLFDVFLLDPGARDAMAAWERSAALADSVAQAAGAVEAYVAAGTPPEQWRDEMLAHLDSLDGRLSAEVQAFQEAQSEAARLLHRYLSWGLLIVSALLALLASLIARRIVSRARASERALRESEERLSLAVESANIGIWDWDVEANTLEYNDQWAHMLGYEPRQLARAPEAWTGIVHEEDVERVQGEMQRHLAGDAPTYDVEVRARRADGQWAWVRLCGRVIERDARGRPLRVVGTNLDVSIARQQAEELRAAKLHAEEMSRLKSSFLANMSHEIRTPLTAVIGFSDVLADELPDDVRDLADLIQGAAMRLMRTLNSVLDLAQIESGTYTLSPTPTDLVAEIDRALALHRPGAERAGVHLARAPAAARPIVDLDAAALGRVLDNLILNAVKFTPAGGHVTVALFDEDERVRLLVSDTGIGMRRAFQDRLFTPFAQESEGQRRVYEGTGLGLSIVQHLVALMAGSLSVTSVHGHGSTFTLLLPARAPGAEAA